MAISDSPASATVNSVALSRQTTGKHLELPDYNRQKIEDLGFVTAMTLVLTVSYTHLTLPTTPYV